MTMISVSVSACASDWPRFRGPNADGIVTEEGLSTDWPAEGLKKRWSANLGAGGGGTHGGAVVANGKVIVPGRTGPKDVLYCFEAATGREIWRHEFVAPGKLSWGSGTRATPTVAGGSVYFLNAFGMLKSLDMAKGEESWKRDLVKEFNGTRPNFGITASPCVVDEVLVCIPGGKNASVVGLDSRTGKVLWKTGHDRAAYAAPIAVRIQKVSQVLAFTKSGVLALDPKSGKEFWRFQHKDRQEKSIATPIVAGGKVYLTNQSSGFVALKPIRAGENWTVEKLWANPKARVHFSQPILGKGCIYFHNGGGSICCIELDGGKVTWTAPDMGRRHAMPVLLKGNHLLALLENGEVVLLQVSSKSYKEKARFKAVGENAFAQPAVADGRLYVRDYSTLACFDLKAK